jgi:hypothetical protein
MHHQHQQQNISLQEDERLTVDDITRKMMRIPLDEISFSTSSPASEDDDSIVSTISNDDNDLEEDSKIQMVSEVPRSIFSKYWKEQTGDEIRRTSSSSLPQQKKLPSCDNNIMDGYKYFGIDRSEVQRDSKVSEDENDSINTYERMLQQYEKPSQPQISKQTSLSSRPSSWMTFFGGKSYHFSSSEPRLQHLGTKPTRCTQSDTALLKKPQKSCLRRGRFTSTSGDVVDTTNSNNPTNNNNRVSFQPKIEIKVFQPPVEKWAPSGWSDWFG